MCSKVARWDKNVRVDGMTYRHLVAVHEGGLEQHARAVVHPDGAASNLRGPSTCQP